MANRLPDCVCTITDGGGKSIEISASGQLLKAVDEFAARWQIDRKTDTLVVDDQTMLIGQVKASNLKVVTRYGTADIPFAEVAMIRGGNGQGIIPRVHLRNGEVLVGDAQLADATLQSTAGIPVKLTIEQLHTLVLARKPADGKPTKAMKLLERRTLAGTPLKKLPAVNGFIIVRIAPTAGVPAFGRKAMAVARVNVCLGASLTRKAHRH